MFFSFTQMDLRGGIERVGCNVPSIFKISASCLPPLAVESIGKRIRFCVATAVPPWHPLSGQWERTDFSGSTFCAKPDNVSLRADLPAIKKFSMGKHDPRKTSA
jgi:hypothetical protein